VSAATDLYQELILDHNRRPRNYGRLGVATHSAVGDNPLCGDHLELFLAVEGGVIRDLSFEGSGCAISRASTSLMTTMLKGKSIAEAQALATEFHGLVTAAPSASPSERLGKLVALAGVRQFPMRVKCATLAWHTLAAALAGKDTDASTE
jgi:nitrogen fixation NifU-like protein